MKNDRSLVIVRTADKYLYKVIRSMKTWFTRQWFSIPMLFVLAFIDIVGFLQIAAATIEESDWTRAIIVSAFGVAFEIAPLYIGYAISLKCYDLGKRIHMIVFWMSLAACLLGVVGNIMYRVMTMDSAYDLNSGTECAIVRAAEALTILMCILPVVTSLMNIVIGCLSFDPLLFDLLKLSKKLRRLNAAKRKYEILYSKIIDNSDLRDSHLDQERQRYNSEKIELMTENLRLKNQVAVCTMAVYKGE